MPWETTLVLPDGDQPAWLRLADMVVAEVRRGRLRPGDALPGTRRVASQLGLHRNTVLRAWSELAGQGWITASQGGATRIAFSAGGFASDGAVRAVAAALKTRRSQL